MNIGIIESAVPVTLLGGGTVYDGDIVEALPLAPVCVAADSGGRHALEADIDLAAVVGDFDSIGPDLERIPMSRQIHIDEQESTDFDKALRHILAPVVLAVGRTGLDFGRLWARISRRRRRAVTSPQPLGSEVDDRRDCATHRHRRRGRFPGENPFPGGGSVPCRRGRGRSPARHRIERSHFLQLGAHQL